MSCQDQQRPSFELIRELSHIFVRLRQSISALVGAIDTVGLNAFHGCHVVRCRSVGELSLLVWW